MMTMRTTMTTRRNSASLLLVAPFLLLSAAHALPSDSAAKKPYALIIGTVYGRDDRPVYGVKVKIRRADQKKAKGGLVSTPSGEFPRPLPAGTADYIVSTDDKKHPAPEIKVHIQNDERQDISLH